MTTTTKSREAETKAMTPSQKREMQGAEATRPGRLFTPAVDILETDDAIRVLADMPGVRADGLNIDLRENVLTIHGTVGPTAGEGERILMREYDTGSFLPPVPALERDRPGADRRHPAGRRAAPDPAQGRGRPAAQDPGQGLRPAAPAGSRSPPRPPRRAPKNRSTPP